MGFLVREGQGSYPTNLSLRDLGLVGHVNYSTIILVRPAGLKCGMTSDDVDAWINRILAAEATLTVASSRLAKVFRGQAVLRKNHCQVDMVNGPIKLVGSYRSILTSFEQDASTLCVGPSQAISHLWSLSDHLNDNVLDEADSGSFMPPLDRCQANGALAPVVHVHGKVLSGSTIIHNIGACFSCSRQGLVGLRNHPQYWQSPFPAQGIVQTFNESFAHNSALLAVIAQFQRGCKGDGRRDCSKNRRIKL